MLEVDSHLELSYVAQRARSGLSMETVPLVTVLQNLILSPDTK